MYNTPFLIISAASSGSTLLGSLLDRHTDIAVGPELFVFNKDKVFQNFDEFKKNFKKYLKTGILSEGHNQVKDFFISKPAYFVDDNLLIDMMDSSSCLKDFLDSFFKYYLKKRNKKIFGEKTGSNGYQADKMLQLYPDLKIIHLIRDPYDSIVSNYKRNNKKPYHAVTHYLYNHCACLRFKDHPNYLRIKYEDMVTDPKPELIKICKHLNIDFQDNMIENDKISDYWNETVKNNIDFHQTWNNNPLDGKISKNSIGKGRNNFPKSCNYIMNSICLSNYAKRQLNLDMNVKYDMNYLFKNLNYNILANEDKKGIAFTIPFLWKSRLMRFLKALKNGKLTFNVLFRLE